MNGIELIAAERLRQVEVERWTDEHDDMHAPGALAAAGSCYALHAGHCLNPARAGWFAKPPAWWPFSDHWWKPKDHKRDLARAGALIAAEIDRIIRDENERAG